MQYQVKLKDIANEFSLEVITVPENYDDIYVRRADVSRPGLPLAGFFDDFESGRIQMIGNMEHSYLWEAPEDMSRSTNSWLTMSWLSS